MLSATLKKLQDAAPDLPDQRDRWMLETGRWLPDPGVCQAVVTDGTTVHRALTRLRGNRLAWDCSCGEDGCPAAVWALGQIEVGAASAGGAGANDPPSATRVFYRLRSAEGLIMVDCHVGTAPAVDLPQLTAERGIATPRPRFVNDTDARILAHLAAHDGRVAELDVLQQLVESQRAFPQLDAPPLAWGGPRPVQAGWELLADGSQRITAALPDGMTLMAESPLVASSGPVLHALDPGMPSDEWLRLRQPVALDQLDALQLPAGVPGPFMPASIDAVAVSPQCRFIVGREQDRSVGRLGFLYGEVEVAPATDADPIAERVDDSMVLHPRDWVLEASALGLVRRSVWQGGPVAWRLSGSTATLARFIIEDQPALEAEGIVVVHGPGAPTIEHLDAAGLRLRLTGTSAALESRSTGDNLLGAGGSIVRCGDLVLVETDQGRVVAIPAALLYDVQLALGQERRPGRSRLASLPVAVEDETRELPPDLSAALRAEVALPSGLQASLREYQATGYRWLARLARAGYGAVLADDMGLGKTVQTIAAILALKEAADRRIPSLVVAPVSVLDNWRSELRRFAPELKTTIHHGPDRRASRWPRSDVVLTTYGLLRQERECFTDRQWRAVVLDEAQAIKNASSRTSQAARALNAEFRLCLTGTPMENHLGELRALFAFAEPGLLGSEAEFDRVFRQPIEAGDEERRQALIRRIGPFMLRRTREQVLGELPPLIENELRVELDDDQRALYESVRAASSRELAELAPDADEIKRRGQVLQIITRLRQAACAPALLPPDFPHRDAPSAKLDALEEMIEELADEGRHVLVFSQFRGMLEAARQRLGARGIDSLMLTGQTRNRAPLIRRFQAGEVPVFLIGLKAGGTGLNLTRADTVVLLDPWWNPAVEAQATARAHRMGQQRSVFVYRLIAADTIEDSIQRLKSTKQALGDALSQAVAAIDLTDPAVLADLLDADAV